MSAEPVTVPLRDEDIRAVLIPHLLTRTSGLVVEEYPLLGTARVDVLAVDEDAIHGYEIKSDADHLTRLPGQITTYDQIFDHTWLVVGTRHHDRAAALIPAHWGLIHATADAGRVRLRVERQAGLNAHSDPRALVRLLWRAETIHALRARGLYRGLSRRPLGPLWDHLTAATSPDDLRALVRRQLTTRPETQARHALTVTRWSGGDA